MPKQVRAYDVVPIAYHLRQPAGARRVAIEAVAVEDPAKVQGRALYDPAIPGELKVNIEYLGSVSADYDTAQCVFLTPDPKTPVSPYPALKRDPLVRSSTIRAADAIWFKFRITNTGNTILSPEGFSSTCMWPQIVRLGSDGKPQWTAKTVNVYERHLNYIYPGESVEQWVQFYSAPHLPWPGRGLAEGTYRVEFTMLYRYYQHFNWGINIWHGKDFAKAVVPITVTKAAGQTPVETSLQITDTSEKMPGYIDAFEQFMTAFKIFPPASAAADREGTVYLQVCALDQGDRHQAHRDRSAGHRRRTNPRGGQPGDARPEVQSPECHGRQQRREEEPAFVAQALPGMRTNFQLGPYPEEHMLAEIREMKALGVNVIANTCGNWWIPEVSGRRTYCPAAESYKYWYDVLVREMGMKTIGRSIYPPSDPCWYQYAAPLLGRKVARSTTQNTYQGQPGVDMGDPAVPEVIAAWTKYCYQRWGDTWFRAKDGRMPITIEDTWGWMRDDANTAVWPRPTGRGEVPGLAEGQIRKHRQGQRRLGLDVRRFDAIDPERRAEELVRLATQEVLQLTKTRSFTIGRPRWKTGTVSARCSAWRSIARPTKSSARPFPVRSWLCRPKAPTSSSPATGARPTCTGVMFSMPSGETRWFSTS